MAFKMTLSSELETVTVTRGDEGVRVKDCGYGWLVEPNHGEWAMVIQYTTRQDGWCYYAVVMTAVDSESRVRHAKVRFDGMAAEIGTACAAVWSQFFGKRDRLEWEVR